MSPRARVLLETLEEALARVARLAQLPLPLAPTGVGEALGARGRERPVPGALVEQLKQGLVAVEERSDRLALSLGDAAEDGRVM